MIDRPPLTTDDRRKHSRRALRVPAKISLRGGQILDVRTFDISVGGLAIIAAAAPRPATAFRVAFALPREPKAEILIEAEAEVLHSFYSNAERAHIVGLRFTQVAPQAASAITIFVG